MEVAELCASNPYNGEHPVQVKITVMDDDTMPGRKEGYCYFVRQKLLWLARIIVTIVTHNAIVALVLGLMWCIPGVMTLKDKRTNDLPNDKEKGAPCDGLAWGFACVILVMGLSIVALTIKWYRARRHKIHDGLYLQISVDDLKETLHLGECLMPMDHLYQEDSRQPLIKDVIVTSGWAGQTVELRWGRLIYATKIDEGQRDVEMTMPARVVVSARLARRLINRNCQGINVRILRYGGGLATVVPKGAPMMSASGWSGVGVRTQEVVLVTPAKPPRKPRRVQERLAASTSKTKDTRATREKVILETVKESAVKLKTEEDVYEQMIDEAK